MSETADRRIRSGKPLVTALAIIAALAVAGLSFWYGWHRMQPAPEPSSAVPQGKAATAPVSPPEEPVVITLYYPADGALMVGSIGVKRQPDLQSQAREAAAVCISNQRALQAAVLKDVRLRAFYLDLSGTAYVDLGFAQPEQKDIRASAWDELMAVYAFVNTLTQNFEEIRQVRFLVEGREAQTLAGHIDLTKAFTKRKDLAKP